MPLYMLQAAYDTEALDAVPATPKGRGEIVAGQLEKLGGRLLGFYQGSGKYDAVAFCELPDDLAAGALAISVRTPAHMSDVKAVKLRGALPDRLLRSRR